MSQDNRERVPVTPEMTVSNANEGCDYYAKYMGATIIGKYPSPDGRLMHAEMKLPNGALIYLKDDFPEYGTFGSELGKDGKPGISCGIALYFNDYNKGKTFWNNFHTKDNTNEVDIEMNFEPQFWGDNYGRFRCKYGHIWSITSPLSTNQKVPERPWSTQASNTNNNSSNSNNNNSNTVKITGKKRSKRDEDEDEDEDKVNDEPPKKKQKVNGNNNNNSNTDQSGFKEIVKNVPEQFGLFMEFNNVGLVSSVNINETDGKDKVSAAGEAYGTIWGFISNNYSNDNPTTSAVALISNGAKIKNIDNYTPGFMFDSSKVSKNDVEGKLGDNNNNIKVKSICASDWYVYTSVGSYDKLIQAWEDARNDLKERGLEIRDGEDNNNEYIAYELYLNEPSQTKESELKTELYIAIKSQ